MHDSYRSHTVIKNKETINIKSLKQPQRRLFELLLTSMVVVLCRVMGMA